MDSNLSKKSNIEKLSNKTSSSKPRSDLGLRSLPATTLFRTFNFELFVKPNKYVMGFGLISISCCVAYLGYLNAIDENRSAGLYEIYDNNGSVVSTQTKTSKWD